MEVTILLMCFKNKYWCH